MSILMIVLTVSLMIGASLIGYHYPDLRERLYNKHVERVAWIVLLIGACYGIAKMGFQWYHSFTILAAIFISHCLIADWHEEQKCSSSK